MKGLVLVWILLIVSCVGCRTLDGKMQHQVGQPRDKLIEEFGPPDREINIGDGRTVVWYQPWGRNPADYPFGTCLEIFHFNKKGIVTSASAHNCVGVCLGPYCWTSLK